MIRIDEHSTAAPPERVFLAAADVERWPDILPHYRRVRFLRMDGFGHGVVEMAAWRDFAGPLRYPTWWVSQMEADAGTPIIRYRHIDGVTAGMDVRWEFLPIAGGTRVRIVHEWDGPPWPVVGSIAASVVIGPFFVSSIARRTLAGVCAEAEHGVGTSAPQSGPPRTRREGAGHHA